ncbi:MAG: hypothetical protein Q8755_03070, partial [Candidatus Phytoplasma australasiaticum]|nr:hypothetical protein [Candidatus Phytoplasma australasiaticum]
DIQQDSISWHEHRNNYINASEVAAIMGLNPFESVKLLFKIWIMRLVLYLVLVMTPLVFNVLRKMISLQDFARSVLYDCQMSSYYVSFHERGMDKFSRLSIKHNIGNSNSESYYENDKLLSNEFMEYSPFKVLRLIVSSQNERVRKFMINRVAVPTDIWLGSNNESIVQTRRFLYDYKAVVSF